MFQNTDTNSRTPNAQASSSSPEGDHIEKPALPPFLAYLARSYIGKLVAVYTGQGTYVGTLVMVTAIRITLDSDSDVLDGPTLLNIDANRIEAIETISA